MGFDMIKKNVSSYILPSLFLVAVMVLPDWALGQKTPPLEKISFGIPAMDAGFLPLFVARDRNFFRNEGLEAGSFTLKADIATKKLAALNLPNIRDERLKPGFRASA